VHVRLAMASPLPVSGAEFFFLGGGTSLQEDRFCRDLSVERPCLTYLCGHRRGAPLELVVQRLTHMALVGSYSGG
jgi:hypothetical protein